MHFCSDLFIIINPRRATVRRKGSSFVTFEITMSMSQKDSEGIL